MEKYDLLIIGAGPAGLTAGIYAGRFRLRTLIIGVIVGGLMAEAHKICNFPSQKEISGLDLTNKIKDSVLSLGIEIRQDEVESARLEDGLFRIDTESGQKFLTKTLLLAFGTRHRKLNLPNEEKFLGRGVSYCATCDGPLFRDKTVAVVGGSNAAVTAALYLSEIAQKVFLIYRKGKLRADPIWVESLEKRKNIEVIFKTKVVGLYGKDNLEKIKLDNVYKGSDRLEVTGLFLEIGTVPPRALSIQLNVEIDENSFIKVDQAGRTNIEGIWAAGDITTSSNGFRQIITACAEGAIAAQSIYKYLRGGRE
jgi:thioredoxin reductase (NADPH)